MYVEMSGLYHVLVLFVLALAFFSIKSLSTITLLFMIPPFGEIVQFFIPGRTPDFMDLIHGYLGILAAYCAVRLWREMKPVLKNVQPHMDKKVAKGH